MTHVLLSGLPPIVGPEARVLIVGSMPGAESLRQQRYYAHSRNAFWPIVGGWLGLPVQASYEERCRALVAAGIALWDVIGACERRGSLDTAIVPESVRVNDFAAFFALQPEMRAVLCNGTTAHRAFLRHVMPRLAPRLASAPAVLRLPSTSPAHAGMTLQGKRERWLAALGGIGSG